MVTIDKADILKQAKEFCEQDGCTWDAQFTQPPYKHAPKGKPSVTPKMREEYIARAELHLRQERSK